VTTGRTVGDEEAAGGARKCAMKSVFRALGQVSRYATVVCVATAAGFAALKTHVCPNSAWISGMAIHYRGEYGWPLVCCADRLDAPYIDILVRTDKREYRASAAVFDVLTILAIVASSLFVAWRLLPRLRLRRLPLSGFFVSMNVIAALAALLRYEHPYSYWWSLRPWDGVYCPITSNPWWICLPMLYGIGCVVVVVSVGAGSSMRAVAWRLCQVCRDRSANTGQPQSPPSADQPGG